MLSNSQSHAWKRPALAAVLLALGAGWTLQAVARQRVQARQVPPPKPSPSDVKAAKGTPAPPVGKSDAGGKKEKWATLDMNNWKHDEDTGVDTGDDFIYKQDDMTVTGQKAKYNDKLKLLEAEGNLVLDDPKHHVTGGKARVDNTKTKLATFTENVIIVIKPKEPKPGETQDNKAKERNQGLTITCDYVDDYFKKEYTILKGHVIFKQRITKKDGTTLERTLTAEHAEYWGKEDRLLLFSPVAAEDSDGQTMKFEKDVTVGTKEGAETLKTDGRVIIHSKVKEEEEDEEDKGATPTNPPPKKDK